MSTASPIEGPNTTLLPVLGRRASSRLQASGILRLWHLASLDAPTVAVIWALAFARAADVRLPLWLPLLLALGTWSIYIGDRLLDAYRAAGPLRERHRFHWLHRRLFLAIAAAASAAALAITLRYMPIAAQQRNSLLGVAALVYFAGIHGFAHRRSRILPKELQVAVIFTLACAMPTLARLHQTWFQILPAALCFTLLAWLNCHAIEVWESSPVSRQTSIFHLALILTGTCTVSAATLGILHLPREAALLLASASSALLLAVLDRRATSFTPVTLRTAADLVLLTPAALLWLR